MDKPTIDALWLLITAAMVFTMQAGFACLESGLSRAKNTINVAIKNLTDFGITALIFWALGFAFMFGATKGGLIGSSDFFFTFKDSGLPAAFFLFELMFCSTSATIISGAVAERMRFRAYIAVTIIVSALIYPVFGHWAWSGIDKRILSGWLGNLGFVDFAGSTVVHSLAGWVALAALLIMGPRSGRFPPNQSPRKIQGHDIPVSVLGVFLLWFGWLGFNGGSTLELNNAVPRLLTNTVLAGASGMLITLALGWVLQKSPRVDFVINGSLAGCVAITAPCYVADANSAIVIGGVGGIAMLATDWLLERLRIDDAVGAIPVHLGAGIWGTLSVAIFGDAKLIATGLSRLQQLAVQTLGVAVCFIWTFGVSLILLWILNRFLRLRVTAEEEYAGLNVSEHGATTELLDFFRIIEDQARTGDLSQRAPVEPFTEVGQIAGRYNNLMESLENKSEELKILSNAVEQTADYVIITDKEGTIKYVNSSFERFTGYTKEEVIGRTPRILKSGRHDEIFYRILWETIRSGKIFRAEIINKKKNGDLYYEEKTITPIKDSAGRITYFVSTAKDISERKRMEEERSQIQEELKNAYSKLKETQGQLIQTAKMSTLGQTAGSIAHEINNPLTGILNNAQLMKMLLEQNKEAVPDNFRGLIETIEESALRCKKITTTLLDFSHVSQGFFVPTSVNEAIEKVIALVEYEIKIGRCLIRKELASDLPKIMGDYQLLQQVFLDLISNAKWAILKKPQKESGVITIRTQYTPENNRVNISVSDTGVGIPQENLSKIFEPFFTTKPVGEGTGLGLAIVQNIIKEHRGAITVDSQVARGTTFKISFPALSHSFEVK